MNLAELAIERARHAGDAVAIQMGERTLTYREFVEESDRVAGGLRALGVKRGDRVMMFSENCMEYLVAYHAVARLGAIFAPVHASFQVTELSYVLANSTPRAIIAQTTLWDRLARCGADQLPGIRIAVGSPRAGLVEFGELQSHDVGTVGVEDVESDEPVLICYTSGITDRPHPVARSHGNEAWLAQRYADLWDYRAGDRGLVTLPLSWVWGLCAFSNGLLTAGATVVLHSEFSAVTALREIEASRISLFAGTMSMYTAINNALSLGDYDLSSLRRLYRGAEPANSEIVGALEARIGIRLSDAYATTEAAPVLVVDPVRDMDAPPGTVGRLVPDAKIRLVDPSGRDVPAGVVGEAWLGGPGVMLGYWNEPELTADRVTPDGWFRSGDLLVEGEHGYYQLVGRSIDIIIRNGAKVAPAEVESALTSLPGVSDSVAVGVPDEDFGESIVAFVVVESGCIVSVDDLYDHLSDRIARFKLPSRIFFVEEIPAGRNAKRDRASVRRQALQRLGLVPTEPAGDLSTALLVSPS